MDVLLLTLVFLFILFIAYRLYVLFIKTDSRIKKGKHIS